MCGRFTLTTKDFGKVASELAAELEQEQGEDLAETWKPRYNVAPTDAHVLLRKEDGRRLLRRAAWGITKGKGEKRSPLQINARSETAAKIPMFREAFAARRCVIPADGFYEWTGVAKARRPIWFHSPEGGLILFAGLYEVRGDDTRFTILTTAANELVAPVHDRMPVVLPRDRVDAWLEHPDQSLLLPAPLDWLIATPVSPRVNSVANDDAACLEPPPPDDAAPVPPQLKLF